MNFKLKTIHILGLILVVEIIVLKDVDTSSLFLLYGFYRLAKYLISHQ